MAVIDSLEFARTGQTLSGRLPSSQLVRLQDSLHDGLGELQFEVKGGHDARRRPVLMLEISGVLHLQCQRCLGVLNHPLRVSNVVLLVDAAAAADGAYDAEEAEWIEASRALDVTELIEDEILLSLPYSPRHAEGQCRSGAGAPGTEGAGDAAFAKLATLRRPSN
jgi:uncharacterized protein